MMSGPIFKPGAVLQDAMGDTVDVSSVVYLDGVTAPVQEQLDGKLDKSGGEIEGNVAIDGDDDDNKFTVLDSAEVPIFTVNTSAAAITIKGILTSYGIQPDADNTYTLGDNDYRWSTVYGTNADVRGTGSSTLLVTNGTLSDARSEIFRVSGSTGTVSVRSCDFTNESDGGYGNHSSAFTVKRNNGVDILRVDTKTLTTHLWHASVSNNLTVGGTTTVNNTINAAANQDLILNAASTKVVSLRVGGLSRLTCDTGFINLHGNNLLVTNDTHVYKYIQIGGGNSYGYLYGDYTAFGSEQDGMHLGYNFVRNNGVNVFQQSAGSTSAVSIGYATIRFRFGGPQTVPTEQIYLTANGIFPTTSGTPNLGSSSNRWNNLFATVANISGNVTIGGTIVPPSGNLLINGLSGQQISFQNAGTTLALFNGTGFHPVSSGNANSNLGTTALRWNNVYGVYGDYRRVLVNSFTGANADDALRVADGGGSVILNVATTNSGTVTIGGNASTNKFRVLASNGTTEIFKVNTVSNISANPYSPAVTVNGSLVVPNSDNTGFIFYAAKASETVNINEIMFSNNVVYPLTSGSHELGGSLNRWGQIYTNQPVNTTSDANKKKDIEDSDLGLEFIESLRPVKYKFINGKSGRTHYGLISQEVESTLPDFDKTDMDFAGFCKDPKPDGDGYDYSLRYTEFIAPMIKAIQELSAKNAALEARIAAFEAAQ